MHSICMVHFLNEPNKGRRNANCVAVGEWKVYRSRCADEKANAVFLADEPTHLVYVKVAPRLAPTRHAERNIHVCRQRIR